MARRCQQILYAYGGKQEDSNTREKKLWFYDILYSTWNAFAASGIISVVQTAWAESHVFC